MGWLTSVSPPTLGEGELRRPPQPRVWMFLGILVDLVVVAGVLALDIRDLWFKTEWLGPTDTYSFTAIGTQRLPADREPLRTTNITNDDGPGRASGWGALLERCETLYPIADGTFFLHVLGKKCQLGPRPMAHADNNATVVAPRAIFTGAIRADSVAWAACRLLAINRRPVICRTRFVEGFSSRYGIAEDKTPSRLEYSTRTANVPTLVTLLDNDDEALVVEAGSPAETELLELLMVIAESVPIGRVTCVEGFVYNGPGHYVSSLYGCGSPTTGQSAIVGHHATVMGHLHQDKAWLTADRLMILGMSYLIRQNARSLYLVQETTSPPALIVEHTTLTNFSSSGQLYTFMISIDIILALINLRSTLEIVRLVLWPLLLGRQSIDGGLRGGANGDGGVSDYQSVLTCPLFRSQPFAAVMLLSQAIAWMLVLPNAVIWTWTESTQGKIQAYLSTLRFWVIVLIFVNQLWNLVVQGLERMAYAWTRRTHVTVSEVMVVASIVAYIRRAHVFSIGDKKYSLEQQRRVDAQSFADGYLAFANAFPEDEAAVQSTSGAVLSLIYVPLAEIVGGAIIGVFLVGLGRLLVKGIVDALHVPGGRQPPHREGRRRHSPKGKLCDGSRWARPRDVLQAAAASTSSIPNAATTFVAVESPRRTLVRRLLVAWGLSCLYRYRQATETEERASSGYASDDDDAEDIECHRPAEVLETQRLTPTSYYRLPLEELVGIPIRARSFIRNGATMERIVHGRPYLRPSAYVEHGIILVDGLLRTRLGFFGTIRYTAEAEFHSPPQLPKPASTRDQRPHLPSLR